MRMLLEPLFRNNNLFLTNFFSKSTPPFEVLVSMLCAGVNANDLLVAVNVVVLLAIAEILCKY